MRNDSPGALCGILGAWLELTIGEQTRSSLNEFSTPNHETMYYRQWLGAKDITSHSQHHIPPKK